MKHFLLTAAIVAAPVAASAVTLTDGGEYQDSFSLEPGEYFTETFEAGTTFDISAIAVSGTGFSSGSDLDLVSFGIDGTGLSLGTPSTIEGSTTAFAGGFVPSFTTSEDFTLTFYLSDTAADSVTLGYSFSSSEVAAEVPLPAAGGLLGLALVGTGVAVRKRKK